MAQQEGARVVRKRAGVWREARRDMMKLNGFFIFIIEWREEGKGVYEEIRKLAYSILNSNLHRKEEIVHLI